MVPVVSEATPQVYRALYQAISAGLVKAAHDISEGGLAVAAAEMCIGGHLGLNLKFGERDEPLHILFGETTGCLLVEVSPSERAAFLKHFRDLPFTWIGNVTENPSLAVSVHGIPVLDVPLDKLASAFNTIP
jgi:phosphoribosylformylglycinamidine synthase subunit PurSL